MINGWKVAICLNLPQPSHANIQTDLLYMRTQDVEALQKGLRDAFVCY